MIKIILVGEQGCGKSTLAKKIMEKFKDEDIEIYSTFKNIKTKDMEVEYKKLKSKGGLK